MLKGEKVLVDFKRESTNAPRAWFGLSGASQVQGRWTGEEKDTGASRTFKAFLFIKVPIYKSTNVSTF